MDIPTYGTLPRQLAKMPGLCLCVLGVYLVVLVHTLLFLNPWLRQKKDVLLVGILTNISLTALSVSLHTRGGWGASPLASAWL